MSTKTIVQTNSVLTSTTSKPKFKNEIIWPNVILLGLWHALAAYCLRYFFQVQVETIIAAVIIGILNGLGVTAGAHRLWAHRTYKARKPLQYFLLLCHTIAIQRDMIDWCRDHRVHHKFTETDADPHNASRGFFFSHVGWLMCRKHPDVKTKGKGVDLSDLQSDPLLTFQRKYYIPLVLTISTIIVAIPVVFWNETVYFSFLSCIVVRSVFSLNATWLVNSAAHMYGNQPYDVNINPRENSYVSFIALGEGFHNYHHTFPWDYSTSEFGSKLNPTKAFIDVMAYIGQAYDLKKVDPQMVKDRVKRTGNHACED